MDKDSCKHPPKRLYSWFAFDDTLCICCCECGEVLKGGVNKEIIEIEGESLFKLSKKQEAKRL